MYAYRYIGMYACKFVCLLALKALEAQLQSAQEATTDVLGLDVEYHRHLSRFGLHLGSSGLDLGSARTNWAPFFWGCYRI